MQSEGWHLDHAHRQECLCHRTMHTAQESLCHHGSGKARLITRSLGIDMLIYSVTICSATHRNVTVARCDLHIDYCLPS